jgi:hypothetical protein
MPVTHRLKRNSMNKILLTVKKNTSEKTKDASVREYSDK